MNFYLTVNVPQELCTFQLDIIDELVDRHIGISCNVALKMKDRNGQFELAFDLSLSLYIYIYIYVCISLDM